MPTRDRYHDKTCLEKRARSRIVRETGLFNKRGGSAHEGKGSAAGGELSKGSSAGDVKKGEKKRMVAGGRHVKETATSGWHEERKHAQRHSRKEELLAFIG